MTLVQAARKLESSTPGTNDFAFWWWKVLEIMRELRGKKKRKSTRKR